MVNSPSHTPVRFTWQSLLWRLLVTILLLLALAGPGLTLFHRATAHSEAPTFSTLNHTGEVGGQMIDSGRY
jgi:hypothetical protein